MSESEKIVAIATHGPEDPERASLPFVVANAALVMDVAAVVILQGTGVVLAQQGVAEHVFAQGLPPFASLLESFLSQGGQLLVCTPCVKERKLEECLIPRAELIAAARVVQECLEAKAVLSY
jgi:predicted peroxiredoxin